MICVCFIRYHTINHQHFLCRVDTRIIDFITGSQQTACYCEYQNWCFQAKLNNIRKLDKKVFMKFYLEIQNEGIFYARALGFWRQYIRYIY